MTLEQVTLAAFRQVNQELLDWPREQIDYSAIPSQEVMQTIMTTLAEHQRILRKVLLIGNKRIALDAFVKILIAEYVSKENEKTNC